jgi:hypothetical protein
MAIGSFFTCRSGVEIKKISKKASRSRSSKGEDGRLCANEVKPADGAAALVFGDR